MFGQPSFALYSSSDESGSLLSSHITGVRLRLLAVLALLGYDDDARGLLPLHSL